MNNWLFRKIFGAAAGSSFGPDNNPELSEIREQNKRKKSELMGESALTTPANSFRAMWDIIKPYWQSEHKKNAWLKTGAIVGMTLSMVGLDLAINYSLMDFFDGLQEYNWDKTTDSLTWFGAYALSWIALRGFNQYTARVLQMDWREYLTKEFTSAAMDKKALPRINSDNIDQRIAEDLNYVPEKTIALVTGATLKGGMGVLEAGATFAGFIGMLADVSPKVAVTLMNHSFDLPYMVPVVIAYAVAGTGLTHLIGKNLSDLNFRRQHREGDYRHSWAHVRGNIDGIGLSDGEEAEKKILNDKFEPIKENWWPLAKTEKKVTWFSASYGQIANIFPYAISLSAYFAHQITLGSLRGIAGAFGAVQNSLSLMVDSYPMYADLRAGFNRVGGLRKNIVEAHREYDRKNAPEPS